MKKLLYLIILSGIIAFWGCQDVNTPVKSLLDVPENLRISTESFDKITLGWDSYKDSYQIEGFNIYRSSKQNGEFELIGSVYRYASSYSDSVGMLETYYYYVTAYSAIEESEPTTIIMGHSSFSYPRDFSYTTGIAGVTLTWTGITGARVYRIYTATYSWSNFELLIETSATSYLHSEAMDSKLYYKLSTVVGDEESNQSPYLMASADALTAPANFSISNGYESIMLSWDEVEGAAKYIVYRSASTYISSTQSEIAEVETPGFTVTDAITATRYYAVAAVKVNAQIGTKSVSLAGALKVLASPTGISGQYFTNGVFELNWVAAGDAESYQVYRSTTSSTTSTVQIGTSTTPSFQDNATELPPAIYYYRVKTVAGNVISNFSDYLSSFIPGRPTLTNLVESESSLRLSWSFTGEPAGTEVNVYRNTAADSGFALLATVPSNNNSYLDGSLTVPGTYYYRLTILLNGAESFPGNTLAGELTGIITGVTATDGTECNSITISWDTNIFADFYRVYYCNTEIGTYSLLVDNLTETIYAHQGLGKADIYYYKVCAVQSGLALPLSASEKGETFGVAPAAPAASRELGSNNLIRITFYPTPGAKRYEIGVYRDGEYIGIILDNVADTYFTATQSPIYFTPPLVIGNYSFRVVAYFTSSGTPGISGTSEVGALSNDVFAGF